MKQDKHLIAALSTVEPQRPQTAHWGDNEWPTRETQGHPALDQWMKWALHQQASSVDHRKAWTTCSPKAHLQLDRSVQKVQNRHHILLRWWMTFGYMISLHQLSTNMSAFMSVDLLYREKSWGRVSLCVFFWTLQTGPFSQVRHCLSDPSQSPWSIER